MDELLDNFVKQKVAVTPNAADVALAIFMIND